MSTQWYGQYDSSDSDKIVGAGFLVNPSDFEDGTKRPTAAQDGDIPADLFQADGTPNYKYNTSTHAIAPIA